MKKQFVSWTAPYPLPGGQPPLPAGEFLLPVCTTRERLARTLEALNAYRNLAQDFELDFVYDIWAALAYVDRPEEAPCSPITSPDEQCITYWPQNPKFSFAPGVVDGDAAPPQGYVRHPWFSGANSGTFGIPLEPTDVICDINSCAPVNGGLGILEQIFFSGVPRFSFEFSGTGTVELHFLRVPLGSYAFVRLDGISNVDIIELKSISTSDFGLDLQTILELIDQGLSGELVNTYIHEIVVEMPGDHVIEVSIMPNFQIALDFFRWGGGIRKVVLCGFEVDCEDCKDCDDCEDCGDTGQPGDCGGCGDDCEDFVQDSFGFDLEELEMLLDCYKHHVGDVKMNAGVNGGAGWLLCDGAFYPKLQYPELAGALEGVTDSNETEFAVPDFSLRSPMGVGEGLDALAAAGESTTILTVEEMPGHSHSLGSHTHEVGAHTHPIPDHSHTVSPATHAHISAAVIIPTKGNGEIGSGTRLLRASNSVGSDTTLTVEPAATAISSSLATTSTNIVPQANTPFNTSAASGTSASAGGGEAHNNVHPVIGVHFFIFAGCAVSGEDCQ